MSTFKGLIAAPYTPVNNGKIDTPQIAVYAKWLKDNYIKGVFVGGTTGEGLLLTIEQRKILLETWMRERSDDFKIYAHIGCMRYDEILDLAQHAGKLGVDVVSWICPIYYRPQNVDTLVEYCRGIAAKAPDTPFYYYHMPSMTGLSFPMTEFTPKAVEAIPTFRGIKYTDGNLLEMQYLINRAEGKYEILNGFDELLISTLHLGVSGSVGSTFNYMPHLYNQMIAAMQEGRITDALAVQRKILNVISLLGKYKGAIITGKHIMELIGLPCGNPVYPNTPLTDNEKASLRKDLEEIGFFER